MRRLSRSARETIKEVFALRRNGYSGPFFVAAMMFAMGAWFIYPTETFATSSTYDVMEELASELAWGVALVGNSLIMLIACLGRWSREVSIAALVSAGLWFIVFASYAAGNPLSAVVPLTLILTFRSLSLFKEFRRDFDPVTGRPYAASLHSSEEDEYPRL